MYYVYIVRTERNTLYTGQTNDIDKRLKEHQNKTLKSAKYLRRFNSIQLVYQEEYQTIGEALRREYEIKKLTKIHKEELIKTGGTCRR